MRWGGVGRVSNKREQKMSEIVLPKLMEEIVHPAKNLEDGW